MRGARRRLRQCHFSGIVCAMKAVIDRAGRIVVPKSLRQALGLRPGQPLEIRAGDGLGAHRAARSSQGAGRRGARLPGGTISPAIPPTERSGLPGLLAALARPRDLRGRLVRRAGGGHCGEPWRRTRNVRSARRACLRTVRCASSPGVGLAAMAWYGNDGWDYYPPYMSVAEKKAHGARALAKLLRKSKRTAEPVVIAHRKRQLTITFWGKAWSDNLERYADLANRLPRGRAYLRNGSVLDLAIAGGRVEAHVAGSELYRVTIGIAPMAKARWRRVVARCTGRIGSLVGLLRGELSDDVLAVLTHAKDGLFPEPREMTLDCSCPDSATVCKHVAAVLYGVGIRLDARPELFFLLRQVDQAELLSSATTATVSRARLAVGKRIADHRLSAVFGIELEDVPPVRAGRTSRRGQRRPSRVSDRGR